MKNLFLLLLLSIAVSSCEKSTPDPEPRFIDMSYPMPTMMKVMWDSSYEQCLRCAMTIKNEDTRIITPNTISITYSDWTQEYWTYNFIDNKLTSITFGHNSGGGGGILENLGREAIKIIEGRGKIDYYIYDESFVVANYEYYDESKEFKMATTCHCYPKTKANLQEWGISL